MKQNYPFQSNSRTEYNKTSGKASHYWLIKKILNENGNFAQVKTDIFTRCFEMKPNIIP